MENHNHWLKQLTKYYGIEHPIYFKTSSAGYYKAYADIAFCADEVLETVVNTPGLIYQINTLGGAIDNKELTSTACYAHRGYPFISELQSYWDEGKQPDRLLKSFNIIQELLEKSGINRHYRNYPNVNFNNWEQAYYGAKNYVQLQAIKAVYDPNDRIQHPQSIKPQ